MTNRQGEPLPALIDCRGIIDEPCLRAPFNPRQKPASGAASRGHVGVRSEGRETGATVPRPELEIAKNGRRRR